MTVAGIDVGLDGGIAFLGDGDDLVLHPTPTISGESTSKRQLYWPQMKRILTSTPIRLLVIEKAASRPGQGVASSFRFGEGYGLWVGLLAGLGISFQVARPQEWKNVVLKGTAKDKQAAIEFCQRRWPTVNLLATPRSKVPHDGMADAACLALYARTLVGEK